MFLLASHLHVGDLPSKLAVPLPAAESVQTTVDTTAPLANASSTFSAGAPISPTVRPAVASVTLATRATATGTQLPSSPMKARPDAGSSGARW